MQFSNNNSFLPFLFALRFSITRCSCDLFITYQSKSLFSFGLIVPWILIWRDFLKCTSTCLGAILYISRKNLLLSVHHQKVLITRLFILNILIIRIRMTYLQSLCMWVFLFLSHNDPFSFFIITLSFKLCSHLFIIKTPFKKLLFLFIVTGIIS